MKAIIVCVDYWDYLSLTLPLNKHHFSEILVVTSFNDINTQEVCKECNVQFHCTDSFYKFGAHFNKWLALEEGLDVLGRNGWLCILDADIVWPEAITMPRLEIGKLYAPKRRMSPNLIPESHWKNHALWHLPEFSGYTQIFNADDPVLGTAPWHELNWLHAGGADTAFQAKWKPDNRIRTPWECLHIGPHGANWCGRTTPINGHPPENAESRRAALRNFMRLRKSNPKDYSAEKIKCHQEHPHK